MHYMEDFFPQNKMIGRKQSMGCNKFTNQPTVIPYLVNSSQDSPYFQDHTGAVSVLHTAGGL